VLSFTRKFIDERTGMANTRLVLAIVAAGVIAAGISTSTAWAGGPGGVIDDPSNDISEAVGTGTFDNGLAGFRATGDTNDEASAAVIAACQSAGGQECTSDEVTNDNLCIVSVADDASDVVAGGAGVTVEAAREDAIQRAAANNTPLGPTATVVISACP
jgi:hypothetical protein